MYQTDSIVDLPAGDYVTSEKGGGSEKMMPVSSNY
jgi:hypothetical protein